MTLLREAHGLILALIQDPVIHATTPTGTHRVKAVAMPTPPYPTPSSALFALQDGLLRIPYFPYAPLPPDTIRVVRFLNEDTEEPDDHDGGDSRGIDLELEFKEDYSSKSTELYYALSYCWGDPTDLKVIRLHGQPFAVTANLHDALVHLRKTFQGVAIWIDAICINQQDLEERNSQVQQMWRIFSCAHTVIAWLGRGNSDTADLVNPSWNGQTQRPIPDQARRKKARAFLLSRAYWSRAWIIPEVMQARELAFHFPFQNSTLAVDEYHFGALLEDKESTDGFLNYHEAATLLAARMARRRQLNKEEDHHLHAVDVDIPIDEVFRSYAIASCADPRDRVFAMLTDPRMTQTRPRLWLKADYSMTAEELWLAVMRQYTELKQSLSWSDLARYSKEFAEILSPALGVDHKSERFGAWLAQHIDYLTSVTSVNDAVALLKTGGLIVVSSDIHPIVRSSLADKRGDDCSSCSIHGV